MPPKHVLNIKKKPQRRITRQEIDKAYSAVMRYMRANSHTGLDHPAVQKVLQQLLLDTIQGKRTRIPKSRAAWAIADYQYSGMAMRWLMRKVSVLRRLVKWAPKDVALTWYEEEMQCSGTV